MTSKPNFHQLPPTFGDSSVSHKSTKTADVPEEFTVNGKTPSGKPRLYVCTTCTRAFARQEHLKRHERSHTKEKPFACNICSRKFSRRDLLLRHSTKLHAGASDVIPRLRRRSVKPKASTATIASTDSSASAVGQDSKMRRSSTASLATTVSITKPDIVKPTSSTTTIIDPVLEQKILEDTVKLNDIEEDENNNLKDLDLRLEFPINTMNRRASFSAMSGVNYALTTAEPYASETVEFSTPQFYGNEEDSETWLNSFPNMDFLDNKAQSSLSQQQLQQQQQQQLQHSNCDKDQDGDQQMGEDNAAGYSFYDVPSRNFGTLFTHSMSRSNSQNDPKLLAEKLLREQLLKSNTGQSSNNNPPPFKPLSPILQESSPDSDPTSTLTAQNQLNSNEKVRNWQETLFNQDINDLEALADLNISKTYGVPQGYSFYGNNDQVVSSTVPNSASLSTDATISPILLDNHLSQQNSPAALNLDNENTRSGEADKPSTVVKQEMQHDFQLSTDSNLFSEFTPERFSKYSRVKLFTTNIRSFIYHSLSKYPFLGVPSPSIPANEILNSYIDEFKNKFLNHHPFIHKSILNEYTLLQTSQSTVDPTIIKDENSIDNVRVSLVCLPLLIATIGAIVSNKKNDAANLYEASRRCIHVYLETRKKLVRSTTGVLNGGSGASGSNSSPLWLIQSLTLSVIYGLFADEEISLNVIIRQVNALNSLIKTSGLNMISFDYSNIESDTIHDEYFKNFIKNESTIRTIHMIFHISTLLSTLYNIVPSLKIDDLCIDLPSSTLLWECSNINEFKKVVSSFEFQPESYQKVLNELLNLDFKDIDKETGLINGSENFLFDNHVSEFGLICIQNGLHQLAYFKQLNYSTTTGNQGTTATATATAAATATTAATTTTTTSNSGVKDDDRLVMAGQYWNIILKPCKIYNESSEIFNDSKILNHYLNLKLSEIISLNKIKENVWLRSFNDINELYYNNFNYGDSELRDRNFQDELIKLVENSIAILKLVFFKQDDLSFVAPISGDKVNTTSSTADSILKLNDFYNEQGGEDDVGKINLNILHKLSLDSQILFDVILVIVKFLSNYENIFKMKMKFNNLPNVSFLQHFELTSMIFNNNNSDNGSVNNPIGNNTSIDQQFSEFDELLFKSYLKFFKIYLNLEQFLKINYDYHDFESEFSSLTISNIINKDREHYQEVEKNLNSVLKDDLEVLRDKDLIVNELVQFKLPFKFLKIGSFLFNFIYDKNFKFVNFKHLSDVLFHLRIFMENKDEEYV